TITSLLEHKVGYAPSGGLSSLREGVANYYSKNFEKIFSESNVAISPANMLIYQLLEICCNSGDEVCIFTPGFPTYFAASKYINLKINQVELDSSDGFQLSHAHVDIALSKKPKVIMVNSGNNPTGAVYDKEVLEYLVKSASEKNIWIISDETYGMLSFNKKYFSLVELDYEKIVVLSSFSKVFSVPGYRVGYVIGGQKLIEKVVLSSSTLYSCLPIFVQEGIKEGLNILDEFTKKRRSDYKQLSSECIGILKKDNRISCSTPDSGFYLFIDIRKLGIDDFTFCSKLLEDYGTALTPGSSFGKPGFVRACFCKNINIVKDGLEDLVSFSKTLV
ncbi:pyridoxal phosphate-dependent aminotransferase, partial [Candidatus Thioglobus sp.]|nr:pyridoxal phosphate-dependent aminotransferase [Candidatus Thioglobus sp.]